MYNKTMIKTLKKIRDVIASIILLMLMALVAMFIAGFWVTVIVRSVQAGAGM